MDFPCKNIGWFARGEQLIIANIEGICLSEEDFQYSYDNIWNNYWLLEDLPLLIVNCRLQQEFPAGASDGVSVEYMESPMASKKELESTHCPEYIQRFLTGNGGEGSKFDISTNVDLQIEAAYLSFSREFNRFWYPPCSIGFSLLGELNPKENRKIGFPWSLAGVNRSTSSVGEDWTGGLDIRLICVLCSHWHDDIHNLH